jgi:SAM-dependent methyltransferase
MRFKELNEISPPTFKGSLTPDLLKSKLWLCQNLKVLNREKFSTIYILGSWYGTMAIMLDRCGIKFKKVINVDLDKNHIAISKKILSALKINHQCIQKDVNTLKFEQLDKNSLIINTSINDINGTEWFDKISDGTLIALQSRNNANGVYDTLEELDQEFFLTDTLVLDEKTFEDPETQYQRFMKIGIK